MKTISPSDIPLFNINNLKIGENVTLSAYVLHTERAGKNTLLTLSCGEKNINALFTKDCTGDYPKDGSYIKLSGTVQPVRQSDKKYEIRLSKVEMLSKPSIPLPVNLSSVQSGNAENEVSEFRTIEIRRNEYRNIFKTVSLCEQGFIKYMSENGFMLIHTPDILPFNIERKNTQFNIDYFSKNAVLAKSPEMYKRFAAAAFDRVFEVTHAFKADKHFSSRHLNEFIRLDFELSYADLDGLQTIVAGVISEMLKMCGEKTPETIPSVTFAEAAEFLQKPISDDDLNPTEEKKLYKYSKEKYGSDFLFVTHLPENKRPFYIKDNKNFDLLYKGTQIASGGEKIYNLSEQTDKIEKMGKNAVDYSEYLSAFRYALPPSAGAVIGLERFVSKLLELDNIRQASLFPRDLHSFD